MLFYFYRLSLKFKEVKRFRRWWRCHSPQFQLPQRSPVKHQLSAILLPMLLLYIYHRHDFGGGGARPLKQRLRRWSTIADAYRCNPKGGLVISDFFVWRTPSGLIPKSALVHFRTATKLKPRLGISFMRFFLLFGVLFMSTSAPLLLYTRFSTCCPNADVNMSRLLFVYPICCLSAVTLLYVLLSIVYHVVDLHKLMLSFIITAAALFAISESGSVSSKYHCQEIKKTIEFL